MSGLYTLDVKRGDIGTVDMVHNFGQFACGELQQYLEMVGQQTASVNDGSIAAGCRLQIAMEPFPIDSTTDNILDITRF